MSFIEFHQQPDGELVGLAAYEADPDWDLNPPSNSDGLLHPRVHADGGTGAWIVFDRQQNLWGAVVRSQAAPFNDCLPPGETLFLEGFRSGGSFEEVLENLKDLNEEAFANPFEALLVDRDAGTLVRFHGSFQSERTNQPPGRWRLDDRQSLESFAEDEWWGFPDGPDSAPSIEQLTNRVSLEDLRNHGTNDGIRELRTVLIFRWTEESIELRSANVLDSSLDWSNSELVPP